jgi:DNA-directed RNA polymerase subunit RPC12/RpoP
MTITYKCKGCGFEFEIQAVLNGSDFSPDFCRKCSREVDSDLVADLAEAAIFDAQHAAGDRARSVKQDRQAGL